jgi:tetratricopeptide (TPR) repeat protein
LWQGLAGTLATTGRPGDAVTEFDRAAHADRMQFGADAPETRGDLVGAATVLIDLGRFDDATQRVETISPGDWAADSVRATLHGTIALRRGDNATAAVHFERLRSLLAAWYGGDSPALLSTTVLLGRIALWQGQRDEAGGLARIAESMVARDPVQNGVAMAQFRGELANDGQQRDEAETWFRRAVTMAEGRSGTGRDQVSARGELGEFLLAAGRLAEAETELRAALTQSEASVGPQSLTTGQVLLLLARTLERRGSNSDAKALRARATAILGKVAPAAPSRWL